MTDWAAWFTEQLQASAAGLVWGFSQIPARAQNEPPPDDRWGTWSPARHIWHVIEYERCLAIPSMLQWLNDAPRPDLNWPDDDEAWANVRRRGFDEWTAEFQQIRRQQIDMLPHLAGADWMALRDTLWGPMPLAFVVTKTFQHTYEHGDALLRMALWWQVEAARSRDNLTPAPLSE
jgi:hypothetical protein